MDYNIQTSRPVPILLFVPHSLRVAIFKLHSDFRFGQLPSMVRIVTLDGSLVGFGLRSF